MTTPTIPQMLNRMNSGHVTALRACANDTAALGPTASESSIRGMRTVFSTLRRWGCVETIHHRVTEPHPTMAGAEVVLENRYETVLTDRGRELLAAYDERNAR